MNSTNNFSFDRTCMLVSKLIKEQPRVFLLRLLLLFGSTTIGAIFIGLVNADSYKYHNYGSADQCISAEFTIFILMFFILGIVYTSHGFNEARNKAGRISLFMLPARESEKYIARFLVYVPLYILLFIIAIFVADAMRVVSLSIIYPDYVEKIHFMRLSDVFCREGSITLAFFIAYQSFYWLGAILWPNNSLIKTFAAFSILSTVIGITWVFFYWIILKDTDICSVPLFDALEISELTVIWICAVIICIINYSLAYMRFKESDVIQRIL